jgi:hypothetical protein
MRKTVLILAGLILLAQITATPALGWLFRGRKDEEEKKKVEPAATVDPTYLDTLNRGNEMALSDADVGGETAGHGTGEGAKEPGGEAKVDGFRVQCFASSNIANARAEKRVLEAKLGLPVYMVFIEPYYKLHVGDFQDRAEAEKALGEIKGLGYDGAWIVRAQVRARQ